jgi:hypothetical protein
VKLLFAPSLLNDSGWQTGLTVKSTLETVNAAGRTLVARSVAMLNHPLRSTNRIAVCSICAPHLPEISVTAAVTRRRLLPDLLRRRSRASGAYALWASAPAIEGFEVLAARSVRLTRVKPAVVEGLVHPVHRAATVYGWEVRLR